MIGLILVLFISIIGTTNLYGQEQNKITIKGVAQDSSGEALPEVLIYEKNNPDNEVFSDIDGNYSIQANPNSTLVFELVGLDTQEIDVNGQTNLNATLGTAQTNDINEVIVVGFGTTTKANVTGAVSQIKIDEVSQPVSNPTQLLYGQASGVNLVQNSGEPGSNSTINIRGAGIGSTPPLIVVDGMIVDSFDEVSPSDIETFTILKDAASASIYGSQAANGVILITTKSGKTGSMKININSSTGYTTPTTLPDMLRGTDYMNAMNEREIYGFGQDPNSIYSEEVIQAYQNGSLDKNYYGDTEWLDELFGTGAFSDQYLSIRGGSEKSRYLFSARYNKQEGTLKHNSELDSYQVRAKMEFDMTDWLTLGTNITGNQRESISPRQSIEDIVRTAMQANPLRPVYYTNGDYNAVGATGIDALNSLEDPSLSPVYRSIDGRIERDRFRLNSQFYLKVKLLEGLTYEPTFNYKYSNTNVQRLTPTYTLYDGPDRANIALQRTENTLFRNAILQKDFQIDNLLRYKRNLGENHKIGGFIGHQLIVEHDEGTFNTTVENLPSDGLSGLGNGSLPITTGQADSEFRMQSFFGRLEYSFKNKYLFEANMRVDEASVFPESDRQAFFPSFSAGWKISEESFMSQFKNLNLLKLRGSWGQLGNTNNLRQISEAPYLQTYNITDGYILGDDVLNTGITPGRLAEDLTWETSESLDFGIDLRMWNALSITADWYKRDTYDIIQLDNTPDLAGTLPAFINSGDVRNTGFEFAIDYNNNHNAFKYNIGVNFNINENEITSLPEGDYFTVDTSTLRIINQVGQPVGSYYGYIFDGIYQSQEEIDNDPAAYNGALPGWKKYRDISGPDGTPDGVIDENDRTIIGDSQPDFTYGINAGASFKGFDFMVTFNGVQGVDRLRPQNGYDTVQGNLTTDWLDRWSPTNPSNELPVIGSERTNFSSWNIVDGSYLRLKVAEFGYTLPSSLTDKWSIDKLRFFVSGTNLLTFTNFTDGFDPEKFGNNWRNENYPLNKTFVMGLNLQF